MNEVKPPEPGWQLRVYPWEKAREPRCLRRGGMDQRAQHMAASYRGWLFPWNLPWTNRGDKLAK